MVSSSLHVQAQLLLPIDIKLMYYLALLDKGRPRLGSSYQGAPSNSGLPEKYRLTQGKLYLQRDLTFLPCTTWF